MVSFVKTMAGLAIGALLYVPLAAASPYPAVYAFGDSLSDIGNVSTLSLGLVPRSPYWNGRFSNGPVWVENLASSLGVGPLRPSLQGGTDFAFGGGETGTTLVHRANAFDLPSQFAQFNSSVPAPQQGALYTVWAGSQDLTDVLSTPGLTPALAAAAVASAVSNMNSFVANLAGRGAKDLLVLNAPDLGRIPYARLAGAGPSAEATVLSQWYNSSLTSSLQALAGTLGLNLAILDTFSLLNNVIANPGAYGLLNVTDRCWTGNYSGSGGSLCSPSPVTQDGYLFWDDRHPTERVHAYLAAAAAAALRPAPVATVSTSPVSDDKGAPVGADPIPEPATFALLVAGWFGLIVLRNPRKGPVNTCPCLWSSSAAPVQGRG
jgi:phospholipase/lecithinase/hemolysin